MTQVVLCLDGLDPDYLDAIETPNWDTIAAEGRSGTCDGVVPTTTNVNNVSIVTASFPEIHGITSNTYYDAESDERAYMIDPELLRSPTVFESSVRDETSVVALVAKQKLERMVGRGCDTVASAENPPGWLIKAIGEAPGIYSGEASQWLLDAAVYILENRSPNILYVSTTDVVPHKHPPETQQATEWLTDLDAALGQIHEFNCDIVATADHGMNHKSYCLDVEAMLETEGYPAEVIRLIRDEHTYHHQNLGGAAYVYLHEHDFEDILWLKDVDGIDTLLSTEAASERFQLGEGIGDAMILGAPDAVFGPVEGTDTQEQVDLRSHGSLYEREVPYVTTEDAKLEYNKDAFELFLDGVSS